MLGAVTRGKGQYTRQGREPNQEHETRPAVSPAVPSSEQPPTRQQRPRREDVRRRLLDAAVRVFAGAGYEAASLDQVAAAAGFTKGAVYSNFASKDELFFALMEEYITGRVVAAREVLRSHPGGAASPVALAEVGRRLTEALTREREWQVLFLDYWRRAVRDEQVRRQFLQHRRALRASIATAVDQDAVPEGFTRDEVVTLILALSNGLAIERLTDPKTVPDDLFGRLLLALPAHR
jgi:AcrR family transcriptional regulator